jgi:hypothetical protein
MSEPRSQHAATLLDDGRVHVVGGSGADLYEPAGETFRRLADGIGERYGHSATKLADGRVLILGGDRADPEAAPVAAIFDPGMETFAERLPADEELLDRMWHTVLPLDDLRVLVVGGSGAQQHYRRGPAVIYDLATDKVLTLPFSSTTWASGIDPRAAVTAAPLPDGRVLMVVKPDDGPPEGVVLFVFDPASEAFERVAEIPSGFDKFPVPVPVTLADGQVLMVFHGDVSGGDTYLYEVYRFDPLEERMTLVTSFEDAWDPTLVALPDGGAVSIRGGSSRSEVNRLVRDSESASPAASRSPGRG